MAQPSKPRPRAPVTLEDLRPLLVGPEQYRIQRIEERLERHFDEMVADVLPEATAASRKKGEALTLAFEPLVDACARRAMSKDPGGFAEVISPALGPAIRKAVSAAFRVLLQKFNVALNRTLSVESMRWRIEARRTGRSFAEVALLRTLVYRVEQVFLIHRETGLLLEHVTSDGAPDQDPDQISAMLSALETFTHEAFHEDARLERFRVGDLSGWVEHGPSALLVAIVRGTAPEDYERLLREAVERAHVEHGRELAEFRGNVAPFARARDMLAECLREHHELPRRARRLSPRAAIAVLATIVALLAAFPAFRSWRERRAFVAYRGALTGVPGLVVTETEWSSDRHVFRGLRDPLAPDPAAVLARSGLDPARVSMRFEPFQSLEPAIVERRAQRILRPPDGVTFAYRDGVLEARGVAPRAWIERARSAVPLLAGGAALDDRQLREQEAVDGERARATAQALERMEVYFPAGSAVPSADQGATLDGIAGAVKDVSALARAAGTAVRIEVIGHVDASGPRALNDALARSRAQRVAAELEARGVPRAVVDARGGGVRAGSVSEGEDARRARSVVLRVELRGAAEE